MTDPLIHDYFTGLFQELAKLVPERERLGPIRSVVTSSLGINAVSYSAGIFEVLTGLVHECEYELELVGVLAHEIGHWSLNHAARRIEAAEANKAKHLEAVCLSGLAAITAPELSLGAMSGIVLSEMSDGLKFLAHSRQCEQEADRAALTILRKSRFPTHSFLASLKMLEKQSFSETKSEDDACSSWARTHPHTEDRATYFSASSDTFLASHSIPKPTLNFTLMKVRLFWLESHSLGGLQSPSAFTAYVEGLKASDNPTLRLAGAYGSALDYISNQEPERAYDLLKSLLKDLPNHPWILYTLIEVVKMYPSPLPLSIETIEGLVSEASEAQRPLLRLLLAEACMAEHAYSQAIPLWKGVWEEKWFLDSVPLKALKICYEKLNNPALSLEMEAELAFWTGEFTMARACWAKAKQVAEANNEACTAARCQYRLRQANQFIHKNS